MYPDIPSVRERVRASRPLIHCITNPISINQCANTVLAAGARPIMAEHPREAAEITSSASALMLNLGNITDARMESMRIAAKTACEHGIPVVLDLVGISCSSMRREYAGELLAEAPAAVIKGNYSEVYALSEDTYRTAGVDAEETVSEDMIIRGIRGQAEKYHCTVLASGKKDIISDGSRTLIIDNGSPQLAAVTGTGCMLGALCAAYVSAGKTQALEAAAAACAVLGIAGEKAETTLGSGTFMVRLFDQLSVLTDETIETKLRLTEV